MANATHISEEELELEEEAATFAMQLPLFGPYEWADDLGAEHVGEMLEVYNENQDEHPGSLGDEPYLGFYQWYYDMVGYQESEYGVSDDESDSEEDDSESEWEGEGEGDSESEY